MKSTIDGKMGQKGVKKWGSKCLFSAIMFRKHLITVQNLVLWGIYHFRLCCAIGIINIKYPVVQAYGSNGHNGVFGSKNGSKIEMSLLGPKFGLVRFCIVIRCFVNIIVENRHFEALLTPFPIYCTFHLILFSSLYQGNTPTTIPSVNVSKILSFHGSMLKILICVV